MRRFFAEAVCPRSSADAVTCVVDNDAPRGDGTLVMIDVSEHLTDESRDELAHMIADMLQGRFTPEYRDA